MRLVTQANTLKDKCFNKAEAQIRFSEINEAYNILSDPRTKAIYDQYGHRGIELDQENGHQGVYTQENFFFRKGFQGTEKSAFDVLKDIFQENDEDDIFTSVYNFGASDSLKATLNFYMNDDDFPSQENKGCSFFESYKPTFMNPEFMMPPPGFESEVCDHTYTTQIFSFFANSNQDHVYTSTMTSVTQNGKTMTSTQETFTDNVLEQKSPVSEDKSKFSNGNNNNIFGKILI
jgi:curved DNA-binding protein CbpA